MTVLETREQRRALSVALWLNAIMFVVEVTGGLLFNSSGLMADGLDMLTDATAYAIALAAIGRTARFKANAARLSGGLLLLVGAGLLIDVSRRFVWGGEPAGVWMMVIAGLALGVNVIVLRLLSRQRRDEVHLKAAWIFTRADVVANTAVIAAGVGVALGGPRYLDLVVGAAIGLYVCKEALEILEEAKLAVSKG